MQPHGDLGLDSKQVLGQKAIQNRMLSVPVVGAFVPNAQLNDRRLAQAPLHQTRGLNLCQSVFICLPSRSFTRRLVAKFMADKVDAQRMEKIVSLCKRRGFIFQSSEI